MNYSIREAMHADCLQVARVQVDSYRTAYANFFPPVYLEHFSYAEQTQDWLDLLDTPDHDQLLVAVSEAGEVLGYGLGRIGQALPPYACELVALHVRREHQRQGIGKGLFQAMADRLQAAGCASLMLWVLEQNPSRAFYERLGGKLVGRQEIELDDPGESWVVEVAYGWEWL